MPPSRTSRRRPRALVLLTALVATLALVLPTTGASAARPGTEPSIVIDVDGLTSSVTTPQTDGAPADFVAVGAPFNLSVNFSSEGLPAPISETKDVTLQVTAVDGSSLAANSTTSFLVPKGEVNAQLQGIVLGAAGNGVTLTVDAVAPDREVSNVTAGTSDPVDVAKDFTPVDINGQAGATVSRDGAGATCSLAADRETCVDLILPADPGNGDKAFFSTGVCDEVVGTCRSGDLMQVLAQFDLDEDNPATFVIKCAKALCGQGAIQRNVVNVSASGSGLLTPAPACASKGVLDVDQPFCVDYVQARRDGAGITYLPVLMPRDARFSI